MSSVCDEKLSMIFGDFKFYYDLMVNYCKFFRFDFFNKYLF